MAKANTRVLRIIYVSAATAAIDSDEFVQIIVNEARSRNELANVTGSLLYTGKHFVQAIEGPEYHVRDIYASIARDTRHCQLRIIASDKIKHRWFKSWKLAYSGQASYVSDPINNVFIQSDEVSTDKIIRILRGFAKSNKNSF